jgi:hypothetical protein
VGKGANHYLGQLEDEDNRAPTKYAPFKQCFWNVRSQRLTLERLLSRYSISSLFGFGDWPDENHPGGLECLQKPVTVSGTLVVDFQYLPAGSSLEIEFAYGTKFGPDTDGTWRRYSFRDDELNKGAVRSGKDLLGLFAPPSQGGWVCLVLREDTLPAFNRLVVRTKLTLPDRTEISCIHPVMSRELSATSSSVMTEDVTHEVWMDVNSYPSFADTFSNAADPVYSP